MCRDRRDCENQPLIFVNQEGKSGWYTNSQCLWASTTEIKGKVTLNDQYEDLQDFFVDVLGVNTLTFQIVYEDLLEVSRESTIHDVKSKIWSLNALLLTEESTSFDPKRLLGKPIFPVRFPGGSKSLESLDTQFSIGDRDHLVSKFQAEAKFLDFAQDEVRRLKPFFDWLDMTHLYISASTKRLTSFSGSTTPFMYSPNRYFKGKAHAILRLVWPVTICSQFR